MDKLKLYYRLKRLSDMKENPPMPLFKQIGQSIKCVFDDKQVELIFKPDPAGNNLYRLRETVIGGRRPIIRVF